MRIIGGVFRGTKLAALGEGDRMAHLRPTTDRVREALFNLLTNGGHGDLIRDARVLDLFAGSGALGLEALSRGAQTALFVDNGAVARGLLRENISKLRLSGVAQIYRRDACDLGQAKGQSFTLIFLDPPYGKGLGERALLNAAAAGWIETGACIAWEDSVAQAAPEGFTLHDTRRYGQTYIHILEYRAEPI